MTSLPSSPKGPSSSISATYPPEHDLLTTSDCTLQPTSYPNFCISIFMLAFSKYVKPTLPARSHYSPSTPEQPIILTMTSLTCQFSSFYTSHLHSNYTIFFSIFLPLASTKFTQANCTYHYNLPMQPTQTPSRIFFNLFSHNLSHFHSFIENTI